MPKQTDSPQPQSFLPTGESTYPTVLHVILGGLFVAVAAWYMIAKSGDITNFNHDVAVILWMAERILDGARLYVDIDSNNPPLIFLLSAIPVAVAKLTGVAPILIYNLFVLAIILFSALLCFKLIRKNDPDASPHYGFSMALMIAFILLMIIHYDFGQRDHLMIILLTPYLLSTSYILCNNRPSLGLRVATALMAGLGLIFKPYFLLAWVLVELILLAKNADKKVLLRAENWIIGGINAVYALVVVLAFPEYIETVRQNLALYHGYNEPIPANNPAIIALLLSLPLMISRLASPLNKNKRLVLVVATLAFVISVYVQGKGFSYHYVPCIVTAGLLAATVVVGKLFDTPRLAKVMSGPAFVIVLTIAALALTGYRASWEAKVSDWDSLRKGLVEVVNKFSQPGEPIMAFSTSIAPTFPVVNVSGASWPSRYVCMMVPPGVYSAEEKNQEPFPYRTRESMGDFERQFVDTVMDDITRTPPRILFFDEIRYKQGFGLAEFDFRKYFAHDKRFTDLMSHYQSIGNLDRFAVYVRTSDP